MILARTRSRTVRGESSLLPWIGIQWLVECSGVEFPAFRNCGSASPTTDGRDVAAFTLHPPLTGRTEAGAGRRELRARSCQRRIEADRHSVRDHVRKQPATQVYWETFPHNGVQIYLLIKNTDRRKINPVDIGARQ